MQERPCSAQYCLSVRLILFHLEPRRLLPANDKALAWVRAHLLHLELGLNWSQSRQCFIGLYSEPGKASVDSINVTF